MNWLITGGCGFIGRNLTRKLVARGDCCIRILDNLSVGTRDDLNGVCDYSESDPEGAIDAMTEKGSVQLIVGDILNASLAEKAAAGMDVIVHLAANTGVAPSVADPRADCMANVVGTLNYLEAARKKGVGRFVFASSGAPIGECEPPIHEELAPHPVSPYGASKLAGEGYCSAYFKTFGLETVALRFGNVYGPMSGRKDSVVARFIKRAMAGKRLEIYGDGNQTRDFIFIDDLISAIERASAVSDIGGEAFQIATSSETTVAELAEALGGILREKGIDTIAVDYADARLGDVRRNFSDTRKAAERLGWQAQVNLKAGLEKTVSWFLAESIKEK